MALVIKKTPAGVWGYQQTGQPERKDGFFYCKTDGDYFMITEGGGSQRLVSQDGDPRGKVHYSNITIDNAGVTLGPYASAAALMNALKGLNYPGFKYPQAGGGSTDQDNKPRTVLVSVVGDVTATNMAAAVNAAAEHTINEQEIVHYLDSTRGIRFRLKGIGKGTYGLGGEAILDDVIDLIVNGTAGAPGDFVPITYFDLRVKAKGPGNAGGFTHEINDIVEGWADSTTYWTSAIFNGGDPTDRGNYTPLVVVEDVAGVAAEWDDAGTWVDGDTWVE